MKILCYIITVLSFSFSPCFAQVLDDEEDVSASYVEQTEDSEELFEDIFSDHIEKEKKIDEDITFDEKVDHVAKNIKALEVKQDETNKKTILEPLDGKILIGITKGSFKIFNNMTGGSNCFFGVTLKSKLNRDIKTLALRLIWQNRAFAFIFRDIPANGAQERFITTSGKYCYNLSGVPDIDVNLCKIKKAKGEECAKRLEWNTNLESPDPSASPY